MSTTLHGSRGSDQSLTDDAETSRQESHIQHHKDQDVQHEAPLKSPPALHSTSLPSQSGLTATATAPVQGAATSVSGRTPFEGRDYEIPDQWENVNELAPISPVDEAPRSRPDLEGFRQSHPEWEDEEGHDTPVTAEEAVRHTSERATQLYTISYLIFFSLFGALARVGLTALTTYPGTPVIFATIWANTAGSFIMGFLAEDRKIFRHEWGQARPEGDELKTDAHSSTGAALAAAKKAHLAVKKTIPLYIGLATGFCGSFTSFSTFIRDAFLALSNNMTVPGASDLPRSRNGGYSFMAMVAVILATVALSLSGLIVGAHLAVAVDPYAPSLPFRPTRKIVDPLFVVLGWGCWLGAVLLSIWPPQDYWRQRTTFALVFAPLGTLLRFYLAIFLNAKKPAFPLGTFAANILGTAVLGMAWDIAHAGVGGVIGCQVLQGVEDGFCGCLTTISTWVAELSTLRRKHSYIYGSTSVAVALAVMIAVMGGLQWSDGFDALLCA